MQFCELTYGFLVQLNPDFSPSSAFIIIIIIPVLASDTIGRVLRLVKKFRV